MLLCMQSSAICPKCGSWMFEGVCPACGTADPSAPEPGSKPPKPPVRKIFPIALNVISLLLVFSSFALRYHRGSKNTEKRAAQIVSSRSASPIARSDQLTGSGRIYLVQMGAHRATYSLDDFAQWLRSKYGLDVEILPPVELDQAAWDRERSQYIAELLADQLKRNPALAADPHAYLIGFTDADMYPVNSKWRFTFTWRGRPRTAVISTSRMQDSFWERLGWERLGANHAAEEHFHARLRRILLKDIAILYWRLPLNYDPASLLQNTLNPDLPLEDIYESDLNPERTRWGRSQGEPCIYFGYSAQHGVRPISERLIHSCLDEAEDVVHDESTEIFEVDLRLGLLVDKHTDFYLPDTVPIQFRRATRDGWRGPMGFGIS